MTARLIIERHRGAGYRRHGQGSLARELEDKRRAEANLARWTEISRLQPSIDVKKITVTLASLPLGASFRLVDGAGRSTGQRLTRSPAKQRMEHPQHPPERLVTKANGEQFWIGEGVRVRTVDVQPEDLHSRLSRMLKAAHRSGQ